MVAYDFSGRSAIITGGARGIGLGIAQRIAASGGSVSLWDADGAKLDESKAALGLPDERIHTAVVDVTDDKAVDRAAAEVEREFGRIDILVASAGITGPNTTTWEYPVDAWRRVIDIDLTGVFLCCRAVVPYMRARNYGRIVNIASIAGKEGNPKAPAYSAAKAGVIGLTKSLGKELADTPITVNCVTPAAVKTDIFDQMTPEFTQFMLSKIPMGRFGLVEEIAALVTWLASEEASFSTGAVFDCSGGRGTY
ncbi:3-oxoacyl-ACP reductase [Thalassobaculum fulvum]|jgi:3-oxoacyl-[acyl-carrier protein] reductase|uniref:3-oxoacyl-ACP reductase n=1 Tax=Thalassobaculum fulvum TaxID=1633335 RepID=A0A919CRG2_9PROT|nr:SDR family NAD(P)-dependent oxidoreductase [Thalassobaculum fulvum]GHD57530.1 3-oxoacyl-ACP reductase [Thalassobaculum fulvum]